MKTLVSKLNLKVGTSVAAVLFLSLSLVTLGAPRSINTAHAEPVNCPPPPGYSSLPTSPVFEPFTPYVRNGDAGSNCKDFPPLTVGIHNSGTWSENDSVQANVGDQITLRVYIHNGAAVNSGAVMHNVAYNVNLNQTSGGSQVVTTQLTANNAQELDGNVTINIPANAHLEYSGGAPLSQSFGDWQPCFDYARTFLISLTVVGPANPTGQIQQTGSITQNSGQCLATGHLSWSTQNVNSAQVTVTDPTTGQESDFADHTPGSGDAPWLQANQNYDFKLYDLDNGRVLLSDQNGNPAEVTLNAGNLNCGPTSFNLTVSTSSFCAVQYSPTFSISGAAPNSPIYWTSTLNGSNTGENNQYYGQNTDGSGNWSDAASPYGSQLIGNWTKTATVGGISESTSFQVRDCSTTSPSQVVCSPANQNVQVGQTANFSATGGTGSFLWQVDGVATDVGPTSISRTFSTVGTHTVKAFSGNDTSNFGTCSVNVTAVATNQVVCSPKNQSVPVGQSITFNATGGSGNGSYLWQVDGVATDVGPTSVIKSFSTAGNHNVTVFSGTGTSNSDTCPVNVTPVSSGNPPVCTFSNPSQPTSVSPTTQVAFHAAGGNNSYVWDSNGSPFHGSGVTDFISTFNTGVATSNVTLTSLNLSTGQVQTVACPVVTIITSTPVNGVCGSANGSTLASFPTSNLCTSGNASAVLGSGPWTWSCAGTNGGTTATCSANKQAVNNSLTCSATTSTNINAGQSVSFTANGGQGALAFSSNTSGQEVGGVNTYTKTFNNAGTYQVNVSDQAGNQVTCATVNVNSVNQNSTIGLVKTVKNNTSATGFSHSVNANQGDTVTYQIQVTNTGSVTLNNVIVSDTFNSGLTYISGTLLVNGQPHATGLSNGGINFGSLNAGSSLTITYQSQVSVSSGSLVNTASVRADNATNSPQSDQALVTVSSIQPGQLSCSAQTLTVNSGQQASFTATGGTGSYSWTGDGSVTSFTGNPYQSAYSNSTQNPVNHTVNVTSNGDGQHASCSVTVSATVVTQGIINLTKTVKNITAGDSNFSHATAGKQGDTLTYQIQVSAGNSVTLNNLLVTDTFASGLNYVSGSLQVNGQNHAPGLSSGGLSFASIGQTSLTITYQATISAVSGTLINTASARADNASNTAQDQATVAVSFVQNGQPALAITKQVEDITTGTGFGNSISASKGDSVKYQVVVKNIGQAAATNVFMNDSNPTGVQPLSNITVSKSYTGGIPQSIALGTLNTGDTVTITYQGTVNITSGNITNTATVSADNATSQNASATVSVGTQPGNPGNTTSNNCVNYSCNTNNTTTTNTSNNSVNNSNNTTNSNNSSTQNTSNFTDNSVNGSYNNNSVNNSGNTNVTNSYNYSNVVYMSSNGNVVPANQFSQLSITKNVRNSNYGTFQNSISANSGDTVQFEIVTTNSGNATANNVRLVDNLPSGISLVSGTVTSSGGQVSDNNLTNGMYLGSLSSGQSVRVDFTARVYSSGGSSVQNTATASSDNAGSVQASAWVFVNQSGSVLGGNVNLSYSKRAVNETKNADATSVIANREDYITYTLTVSNNGNTPATNFIITDDLSQVLPYADITDNGGGQISGNTISYPGITVPAGGSVTRSFKVRVKYALASNLSYVMTNTYGNTLTIRINTPQVLGAFVAPKTGADTLSFVFSGLITAGAALFRKRKALMKIIFT